MKILVLGNGFDIDHDLPTSYMDFLKFCNCFINIKNGEEVLIDQLKESQQKYLFILKENKEYQMFLEKMLHKNCLLNYFNGRIKKMGHNWIDFEQEIKNIVNVFREIEMEINNSNYCWYMANSEHKVHRVLKELGLEAIDKELWDEILLEVVKNELYMSFEKFACALEFYISTFVNTTKVQGISPDILDFLPDRVISFNYSNTYERIYGSVRWGEYIEYIHGQALCHMKDETNIVLGITTPNKEKQEYYVEFEKYFQRITKKTSNEYMKWLQISEEHQDKVEVMFFGHSLDSADRDVIGALIENKMSKIYIYYYNDIAFQQIVGNLIDVLGKGTLISYVSGNNPKIEFKKQQKHQKDNTGGIQISSDIRSLYRMYSLNDKEINRLLQRIQKKVNMKDKFYFYNQKKTISLYEALMNHGLHLGEELDYLDICDLLDYEETASGQVKHLEEEEWYDFTPWGTEVRCTKETSNLIKKINERNFIRFDWVEGTKIYTQFMSMRNSVEMKDALLELLDESAPNEKYWDMINELVLRLGENKILEESFELIKKEELSLPIESKLKHFIKLYESYVYDVRYKRAMLEKFKEE